jgi:hypothetical protein
MRIRNTGKRKWERESGKEKRGKRNWERESGKEKVAKRK